MAEETQKTKAELFAENPDRFEDLSLCKIVIKKDPESGKFLVLNQCENIEDAFIVEGYMREALEAYRNAVRVQKAKGSIISAGGRPSKLIDHLRGRR